ncbi:MAG: hypothetical protein ABMB14_30195 [Myxococcota bacterium]
MPSENATTWRKAEHRIVVDLGVRPPAPRAVVTSTIKFDQTAGQPVFDLVPNPLAVRVDSQPYEAELFDLSNGKEPPVNLARRLPELASGQHTLEITHRLDGSIQLRDRGIELRFAMDDQQSRGLIERYLPARVDAGVYDQEVVIEVRGCTVPLRLFASGVVQREGDYRWRVSGKAFRSSSMYLHLVPEPDIVARQTTFDSRDGRRIEVTCHADRRIPQDGQGNDTALRLARFEDRVLRELAELEAALGPFPHPRLEANLVASGFMEYAGAVEADEGSLRHELLHQWFGRSAYPGSGNDLWIDEAIATWFAEGEQETHPELVRAAFPTGSLGAGRERAQRQLHLPLTTTTPPHFGL